MTNASKASFSAFPRDAENVQEYYNVSDYDLRRCTGKQRSFIYSLLSKARMGADELMCDLGFEYDELKEITIKEAGEAIDYLKDIIYNN